MTAAINGPLEERPALDRLVDELREYPHTRLPFKHWCHLVSDQSFDELHAFAARMGIPRHRFQGDHYDLPAHLPRAGRGARRGRGRRPGAAAADGRAAGGSVTGSARLAGRRHPPH